MVDQNDRVDTSGIISALINGNQLLSVIAQKLSSVFPIATTTTHTASAGVDTLPANPSGFLTITAPDGNTYKVPLYDP